MKWLKWYVLLMLFIIGVYMYAEYKRPPELNWTQTLNSKDKIPFGTYILYRQIEKVVGTKPYQVTYPVYDIINGSEDSAALYMLVANNVITTETDEEELLKFIALGNTVFISSENLSQSMEDTLNLSMQPFMVLASDFDSSSIRLVNPVFGDSTTSYTMLRNSIDGHFSKLDTANTEVLGMNSAGKANFIRMKFGNGYLYLHAAPLVFTNYFILKDNNQKYVEQVLSYLPSQPYEFYWDEYYNNGHGGPQTPLRVILSKANLKYAYFTALFALILFVIFQSKRRQRVIPIVVPPGNATLEFVETVSRVYFNQSNHHNIALKKITYLLDYIRNRFGIATHQLDHEFITTLAVKTGVGEERAADIVKQIHMVRASADINGPQLLRFSQQIDEFKNTISK
jgi:hypothetical protein